MSIKSLLSKIRETPEEVQFDEVIDDIGEYYEFVETGFWNGDMYNAAGENNGSCRIFYFAEINGLDQQQTLNCFGRYYREDVLCEPGGDNHKNIRQFIRTGWGGMLFEGEPLKLRNG